MLGGIGFTMSLFIAELALDAETLADAKFGILFGSSVAAALGMAVLSWAARRRPPAPQPVPSATGSSR
jgi:NhaA family Na+:H+ antiporter